MKETIKDYAQRLHAAIDALPEQELLEFSEQLYRAYRNRKQVFVIGNGGSASTASHMAADLAKNTIEAHMPRFKIMSLNDNIPLITALSNDLSYDDLFSEQLTNLLEVGDIVVVISGSGNSKNILRAIDCAQQKGVMVVGMLGMGGGIAKDFCDIPIIIDSDSYGIIEDLHLIINHILVEYFTTKLKTELA